MCDIYYLDQFREAVMEKNAEAAGVAAEAEELMLEAKSSLKRLDEHTVKLMLDLAFNKIAYIPDNMSRVRLIRYAVEQCRQAKNELPDA
ncbi:hypothetical protein LCGC14_0890770 [marine sediment metagenome]|uniref:Uncharacterized protein n=1 Tax=marine sediment metagenome TaxID=412755 RepID=A0A0F9PK35_9ZZZZ